MKLVQVGEGRLVLAMPEQGMPVIVSWMAGAGESVEGLEHVLARAGRVNGMDIAVPSAVWLPTGGQGLFGWPAIAGHRSGKDFVLDFASWSAEKSEKGTLLRAVDLVTQVGLEISLRINGAGILITNCAVTNNGGSAFTLDRCMAGTMLVPGRVSNVVCFEGGWGREFHERRELASAKLWIQESRRGRTSHDRYPAVLIESIDPTQGRQSLHALHLGWSGNHMLAIDPTDDGRYLVHVGELFEPGEVILEPGECYRSPNAYGGLDAWGFRDELMHAFHTTVRSELMNWPGGSMKPRPVTLNTWEGNYFDHKIEDLKQQASVGAGLGIERFVLDDGWFGKRDSDNAALGDWCVDARKYPQGLKPLIDHVKSLGMEFGIWIEPEMISPDSDLFRAHPDWALQLHGRPFLLSRNQLVLDLSRREASDYVFARIDALIGDHAVDYVKWDMNRDLAQPGDREGRAATSRQTRAVYALMDRIRKAHPLVELESCASGGGRADYGILSRSHRIWTSDCTDALERLSIQRGARCFLPPEILGCHISASPNHQTGRRHRLSFRAVVAFFGHFGIELDPRTLSSADQAELKQWIDLHKKLRPILHHPDTRVIDQPIDDGRHVFGVHWEDGYSAEECMIVAVAQSTHPLGEQPHPLRLAASDGDILYVVRLLGPSANIFVRTHPHQLDLLSGRVPVAGRWLRNHGLQLPQLYPESAVLLEIRSLTYSDKEEQRGPR